jgi:hypothetical protein
MNDRSGNTAHTIPRQPDTYLHSRTNAPHRCYFGSAGRCSCGKHRDPMGVSGISPMATADECLAFEL